jgi:hypothetical protein
MDSPARLKDVPVGDFFAHIDADILAALFDFRFEALDPARSEVASGFDVGATLGLNLLSGFFSGFLGPLASFQHLCVQSRA